MTLNGVIALILLYFTYFDSIAGLLQRAIFSAKYRLSLFVKLIHPAARSLCDS